MKNTPKPSAKILCHSEGVGPPNSEMVRQRAQEIALINGRAGHNEEDWKQAMFELHGHPTSNSEDQENETTFSSRDMLAYDSGHHTENATPESSDNLAEELVGEGLDEAFHDQMLQARLSEDKGEEPEEP